MVTHINLSLKLHHGKKTLVTIIVNIQYYMQGSDNFNLQIQVLKSPQETDLFEMFRILMSCGSLKHTFYITHLMK